MPEMLSPGAALVGAGLGKDVALVTDGTCPRVPCNTFCFASCTCN